MKTVKREGGFLLLDAIVSILVISAAAIALISFLQNISSTAQKSEEIIGQSILKSSILAKKLYTGHE